MVVIGGRKENIVWNDKSLRGHLVLEVRKAFPEEVILSI